MGNPLSQLDPRIRRFEQIWNTYVRRWKSPWRADVTSDRYWASRRLGDSHGPQQYIELQESSHVLIEEVVRRVSSLDAPILDLGCNVGRHLNALHKLGHTNLYGVDIQKAAIEHMGVVFPEMKAMAHITHESLQNYLPQVPDRFFEVVFTHGATLELIHPKFPVCQHMARSASRAVVLVVIETGHAFPRLWETEFLRAGFLMTKLLRPILPGDGSSLLVFQPMTS